MQNHLTFEMNQILSILLDSFAITILLVILFTMLAFKAKMPKLRKLLGLCSLFGIISSIADIIYLSVSIQSSMSTLFYELTKVNALSLIIFLYIKERFTLAYIDERSGSNKLFKIIISIIAGALIIMTLVPSLYSSVNYIVEGSNTVLYGNLHSVYVVLLSLIEVITFVSIIVNYGNILHKNSIILALFQTLPIIVFFMSGQRIAPALLFMSLFLLVAYIIIFQGAMIKSYEQDALLARVELDNKDMRTKLVLSQVQPHFLYNTLSSIAYYCKNDPDIAKDLTINFSSYLRNNIDSIDGDAMILFSQELEHVNAYLDIEKVRFKDRIHVIYDIAFDNFAVPSLVLQPIVENAVKHGICKKEEGGTITISTSKSESYIEICVADDGVGFNPEDKKDDGRSHIGIENARERISILCHGTLSIESAPGLGTKVFIRIPVEVKL